MCEIGPPLVDGCEPCVTSVCAADSYCCATYWDATCLQEVFTYCGIDCWGTGGSGAGGGAGSCDDQYDQAPSYSLCQEAPSTCQFSASVSQYSCHEVCTYFGGECFDTYNNQGPCGLGTHLDCNTKGYQSVICICSRGCGNGPPCTLPSVCVNGVCQ